MDNGLEIFERAPVPKAILKNAIPAIISMIVVLLYNIADTFFVGQTGDPMQVAAVSLTTPFFMIFTAVGVLFGIGGTSVISRALGEGRKEYAKKVSSFCFWASVSVGVVFTLALWLCMTPILGLIGAKPDTVEFVRVYLKWIALAVPFSIVQNAFSNIIRAEGKPMEAMMGGIIGTVANIILDPVMILGLGMGVRGAAIATVIGNILGAGYYVMLFIRKKFLLSIAPRDFAMGDKILTGVLVIGIPASLNSVLMSVSNIVMNNVLAGYGSLNVAAMGIAMKVSMIVVLLQVGLGQGIQPLLGFNYGARNDKRARSVVKTSLVFTVAMGMAITLLCWFGSGAIVRAFIDNEAVYAYGIRFVKALLISCPVLGILFVFSNALQAMGAAVPALILSLSRQVLAYIPILFVLNALAGLDGVMYTQAAADILSILFAAPLYFYGSRRTPGSLLMKQEQEKAAPNSASAQ